MDCLVKCRAGLLLIAMFSSSACATQPVASGSLCDAAQTTYLSCHTAKHKTISVCGALPDQLQYRYGNDQQVELTFPDAVTQSAQQFAYAHYSRYQTERSEVSFSHGDADYTLFDYTENGQRSAGVQVSMADGKTAEIRCAGSIQGSLLSLGKSLHCDRDSALNGGQCP